MESDSDKGVQPKIAPIFLKASDAKAHQTLTDKRNILKHSNILKLLQGQTGDTFLAQLKR